MEMIHSWLRDRPDDLYIKVQGNGRGVGGHPARGQEGEAQEGSGEEGAEAKMSKVNLNVTREPEDSYDYYPSEECDPQVFHCDEPEEPAYLKLKDHCKGESPSSVLR